MADITMPQLGETVTEGTITKWLKRVGDAVAEDDVLFEVSTDKVDSEVPSPVTGFMAEILVAEGETVDVGTKLAVISSEATGAPAEPAVPAADDVEATSSGDGDGGAAPAETETPAAPEATASGAPAAPEAETPGAPGVPEAAPPGAPGVPEAASPATPAPSAAPPGQAAEGGGPHPATGSPGGARGTRPASERPPSGPGSGSGASKVLSPVVRRLIAEHGLDPGQISGTGAGGRITRDDVLALIDLRGSPAGGAATAPDSGLRIDQGSPAGAGGAATAPDSAPRIDRTSPAGAGAGGAATGPTSPPRAAPAPATPAAAAEAVAGEDDTIVPFTNIRRRTAEHMVRSLHTSAHTIVAMEIDYSAVERVRTAERERFQQHEGVRLNYLPFLARAVVDAIAEWPHVNSSVGDDALIVHNKISLGIAVNVNFEGLLVPVIHNAGDKRLRALAREIASLAERARTKRLTMDDISGGTFTLTNAGPFGTLFTIPVINQPQVAIIATDGIRKIPVVVELPDGSDSIAIHPVGNLVLSFDHRAIDGAYAAAFMQAVKENLETRDWSSEL